MNPARSPGINKVNIFRSTAGSPTLVVSSDATLTTRAAVLDAGAPEIFTMVAGAAATVSSTRNAFSRRLSTGARRTPWLRAQPSPPSGSVEAVPASRVEEKLPEAAAAQPDSLPDPEPEADLPKPPPRAEKIELTIESLQNYELAKPIPVIVEPLGDKVFVAEVPDLNISITGNSVSDTLILLKDHITTIYEGLRIKKSLDPERTRQLKLLESYIGKSRRTWF